MSKISGIFILFLFLIIFKVTAFGQGKKVAYCSNQTESGFIQIFIMNLDGSEKKQLTEIQENCMRPHWSQDGKQIVFYTDKGYIYLIRDINSPKGKDPFYVWNGTYPSFMTGGDQIMYNDEYEDVLSIMVIDTIPYGAEPQLISNGGYSNMQTLTTGGNKIYFSTFDKGTKVVKVMDLDDTTSNYIKKVSMNDEANLEPDVSSDEKKITYASFDANLKGTIRILENGSEKPLTKGMASSNVPRFSPDGSKIAFVVIDGSDVSLYVMNSDGSSKKNLNVRGGNVGTFEWISESEIIYDAGSETKTGIGVVNIATGDNKLIAESGFNLHPVVQK